MNCLPSLLSQKNDHLWCHVPDVRAGSFSLSSTFSKVENRSDAFGGSVAPKTSWRNDTVLSEAGP